MTLRCDHSCAFCDIADKSAPSDADTESVKRMIDTLAASSVLVLCLEGGEPFLRDDIGEILEYAAMKPFFVSVVSSYPDICDALGPRLSRFIDYMQISVDEGHDNLELLSRLKSIKSAWDTRIGVQSVVTADDMEALRDKVRLIRGAGCKIVVMPAVNLDGARHGAPPRDEYLREIRSLKRKHPRTVATSYSFLRTLEGKRRCSTASIIIDPDGSVFYPCRTLGERPFNLLDGRLDEFLRTPRARELRRAAESCRRDCGWYQYYAVSLQSLRELPYDLHLGIERMA